MGSRGSTSSERHVTVRPRRLIQSMEYDSEPRSHFYYFIIRRGVPAKWRDTELMNVLLKKRREKENKQFGQWIHQKIHQRTRVSAVRLRRTTS